MKDGFVKVAAAIPDLKVGAPLANAKEICALIDEAYEKGVGILAFPELAVTGYTCGDLFHTESLIRGAQEAIGVIREHTAGKKLLVVVGAPVRGGQKLYDAAVVLNNGAILGVMPKVNLVNNGDTYESRWFYELNPDKNDFTAWECDGTPFTVDCSWVADKHENIRVSVDFGSNLFTIASPADHHAQNGADIIISLAASPEIVGREDVRRAAVKSASSRQISAVIYANAGMGESTTDGVWSGHSMIAENGKILAENKPFEGKKLITAVIDTDHLVHDRMKNNVFAAYSNEYWNSFELEEQDVDLTGVIDAHPFIPADEAERRAACKRILEIQAHGLAKRITAAHANGCVIALSGGLDSTLALIATAKAMDILGRPRTDILSVTMPCFGTTSRTRSNAERMAEEFGTDFRTIDIKESVDLHFRDIGHDKSVTNVVFENAQARERTQIIMDIANADNSLVIGTGDLSELALGWATYNGDHMSNYGVNCGIPKTLIRHVVSSYADECESDGKEALASVLRDVLDTPVSPELLPAKDGEIQQKTEDIVGPYDLHDFFLYRLIRYGETPERIYRVAIAAFAGQFDDATIEKWLNTFMRRFFTQQFKRSAVPDGVKVGEFALSPRGDWKMPSDACGDETQFKK